METNASPQFAIIPTPPPEDDGTIKAFFYVCAALAFIIFAVGVGFQVRYRHEQAMARLGYEQVMVVGHSTPIWQPAAKK